MAHDSVAGNLQAGGFGIVLAYGIWTIEKAVPSILFQDREGIYYHDSSSLSNFINLGLIKFKRRDYTNSYYSSKL